MSKTARANSGTEFGLIEVLIEELAQLNARGRRLTVTLVGEGSEGALFREQVERLGRRPDNLPQRHAGAPSALGRVVMVPSCAESMPMWCWKAAAAGKPLVAIDVGGIPQIFGAQARRLVSPTMPAP